MGVGTGTCEVTFHHGDVRLAGTLSVPDHPGRRPGVVMIGGSGPADRHNDVLFPPIRQHLLEAGIAVLSYDKRGVGASSGDWIASSLDDLAADADAAVRFLRAQPAIEGRAVGIVGHSEGGWVGLRAAAALVTDVAFVVTSGCPGMSPAVQDRYALANLLRQVGQVVEADIDRVLALHDRLVAAGRRGASFAEATRIVRTEMPAGLPAYWHDVDERLWEFMKRKQDHDPVPDQVRLRCPHLATFGGADQIVPVAESVHLFGGAACRTDRDPRATLTVQVFPAADHRLLRPDGTFAHGYLDTLAGWILARI
ncbi:alpha/beta hydrolase family protein [Micromonospora sp. NPDC000442]|uniref:alpha/beta hydrolase family protein n=1 Tax=Micromonospora sp. NPDC000442 TaxID=3364217 RepID=UPI00368A2CAD